MANKMVSLEASASKFVLQDKAQVTLRILLEGIDKVFIQNELKKLTLELFALIKETEGVKYFTMANKIDQKVQFAQKEVEKEPLFTGYVLVGLISYDFLVLNQVLDNIAQKLSVVEIHQITTSVSSKQKQKHEEQLTKDAIEEFKNKASVIAKSFDFKTYQLEEVTVHNSQDEHRFNGLIGSSFGAKESAKEEVMFLEPRDEKITVRVNGKVKLVNNFE